MTDLEFVGIQETTIEDVVNSRMIADPLHLLECCMVSDGGGAVVIASADVRTARSHRYGFWALAKPPSTRKMVRTLPPLQVRNQRPSPLPKLE